MYHFIYYIISALLFYLYYTRKDIKILILFVVFNVCAIFCSNRDGFSMSSVTDSVSSATGVGGVGKLDPKCAKYKFGKLELDNEDLFESIKTVKDKFNDNVTTKLRTFTGFRAFYDQFQIDLETKLTRPKGKKNAAYGAVNNMYNWVTSINGHKSSEEKKTWLDIGYGESDGPIKIDFAASITAYKKIKTIIDEIEVENVEEDELKKMKAYFGCVVGFMIIGMDKMRQAFKAGRSEDEEKPKKKNKKTSQTVDEDE